MAAKKKTAEEANEVPQAESNVERFWELLQELSEEDRDAIRQDGVALPAMTMGDRKRLWGYRCKSCNQVALEFVGTQFWDAGRGMQVDRPTENMKFMDLQFVQPKLESDDWNRLHPVCQHCKTPVSVKGGKLRKDLVLNIGSWLESRIEAEKLKEQMRIRGETSYKTSAPVETIQESPDGPSIRLKDSRPDDRSANLARLKSFSSEARDRAAETAQHYDWAGEILARGKR